ncbi:MAG TPA: iron-containing alcohol dehydrogenase [Acholeplasmataceae bacterium]|nr:iron-containing alcohol dehydrogenase [Acholeplasmataceae bacterium]
MRNFIYDNSTIIIFGKDTEKQIGIETKKYGKKVLLHYGGGSIKRSGLYDQVISSLKEENVEYLELGGVLPNPRLSLVREGIKLVKENQIDFILAVGGGSVIDSAKAISIGAKYDKDVWDFFDNNVKIKDALPIGVILTLPAAGSETSHSCVITNEKGWYKRSAASVLERPKFAIMNPELTFTLPNYQTASGATDMIAHVMERYFTNEKDVEFTDQLCEATIRVIIDKVKICLKDNNNYSARAELMWAGTIAHNGLLGTGRIEDWASHGIEHELSGIYDITHGAGLAIIFPAWMKYVYKHDLKRFARFANKIFDIKINKNNLSETALKGIKKLEEFFQEINMPITLKEVNISNERFNEMALKATENGKIGNFVKLGTEDVKNILKLSI